MEEYARLIVERCLGVQPRWQVLIRTTPLARPLLEELVRQIARRGAYPIVRLGFELWPTDLTWAEEASVELLSKLPPADVYASEHMDARVSIVAPENLRAQAALGPEKLAAMTKRTDPFLRRTRGDDIPWVSCQFPTSALAQDADMTLAQFTDFLFAACLLDWDAEAVRMERIAARFDAADEVRIVGLDTDLRVSLRGRHGAVDAAGANLPAGEVFYAPVEDSAAGTISFIEFPAVHGGREVLGATLVFEAGRVVEARAEAGEDVLLGALDTDEGARRLGEFGIGCNPGIERYMRNPLFDEKINGTIHLALGASYTSIGGQNDSALHWDLVKDLRRDGRIELDGEVVQENGRWLFEP